MYLRIATYNIHRCIGGDGQNSRARIAEVLRQIDPDVTALQEVPIGHGGPEDILGKLADSIGAQATAGPTLLESKGAYGNAVLTKSHPSGVKRLDISVPGREPRGAMTVLLTVRSRLVRIVTTHLGLRPSERRYQMQRLLTLLDGEKSLLTIVLGDFNEWFCRARHLQWLNLRLGKSPAPPTFPSRRPLLALDRIWVNPSDRLLALHPYRTRTARIASDHLPLVAKVRV